MRKRVTSVNRSRLLWDQDEYEENITQEWIDKIKQKHTYLGISKFQSLFQLELFENPYQSFTINPWCVKFVSI